MPHAAPSLIRNGLKLARVALIVTLETNTESSPLPGIHMLVPERKPAFLLQARCNRVTRNKFLSPDCSYMR